MTSENTMNVNKYGGQCSKCDREVKAYCGVFEKERGKWQTMHRECTHTGKEMVRKGWHWQGTAWVKFKFDDKDPGCGSGTNGGSLSDSSLSRG